MLLLDEQIKALVFEAMQNAIDNGHTFMGLTDIAVAEDLVQFDSDLESYEPEDLAPFVKEFVWKSEVDKIEAFIDAGNLKDACDRLNMFVLDIQTHIYKHLPEEKALKLAEYDRTDESYRHE